MMKCSFMFICALLVVIPNEAQLIGTHSGSVGTSDVNFEQCRTACPFNTNDSKPVCGSDGRTYPNVESLACATRCGREVRVEYEGYCPNDRL